jgi:hypothetical protein
VDILFVIVFFAAIIGVFKPYLKGVERLHFGIAAFIALVVTGLLAEDASKPDKERSTTTANRADGDGPVSGPPEAPSNWTYSVQKDEMRGQETRQAQIEARNTIDLDFPYGEQRGLIVLRKSPKLGFDVLVGVPSGQIMCNAYTDTYISVKFDDKPIRRYGCTDASDGSSNMIFVEGARGFLASLKVSKKVTVEAEFFQNGLQQMTFDTANLKWEG